MGVQELRLTKLRKMTTHLKNAVVWVNEHLLNIYKMKSLILFIPFNNVVTYLLNKKHWSRKKTENIEVNGIAHDQMRRKKTHSHWNES